VDLRRIQDGIREQVVGREEEAQLLLAALGAGRDLLLEGPPGTSKSTLLRAVTALNGTSLRFIEGNADLTPSKTATRATASASPTIADGSAITIR
jgi:MoxR-like ATPase